MKKIIRIKDMTPTIKCHPDGSIKRAVIVAVDHNEDVYFGEFIELTLGHDRTVIRAECQDIIYVRVPA